MYFFPLYMSYILSITPEKKKKNKYCLKRRNKSIAESLSLPPCWLHIQVIRALSKVERHCDWMGGSSGLLSFPRQEGNHPPDMEMSSVHPSAGRMEFTFPPTTLACNSSASEANTMQELGGLRAFPARFVCMHPVYRTCMWLYMQVHVPQVTY